MSVYNMRQVYDFACSTRVLENLHNKMMKMLPLPLPLRYIVFHRKTLVTNAIPVQARPGQARPPRFPTDFHMAIK